MTVCERFITVGSYEIRLKSANENSVKKIVLLHGMAFTADTWDELGTLDVLESANFGVFALDMPGFGKSTGRRLNRQMAAEVLKQILDILHIDKTVLVGPSMGGGIVLAFAVKYPEYINGLVLIAPAGLNDAKILDNLEKLDMPALIFWGERDRVFPLKTSNILIERLQKAKLVICPKARHPCYLDTPEIFHKQLIEFLDSL